MKKCRSSIVMMKSRFPFNYLLVAAFICSVIIVFSSPSIKAEQHASDEQTEEAQVVKPPKADFSSLQMSTVIQVQDVLDPLRLRLTDGRIVQLSSLSIPDMTPYDVGETGIEAQKQLKELLINQQVRIYQTKNKDKGHENRMGHLLAQVELKNGELWIQGYLLRNGWAQVMPTKDNTEMATQMLSLEQAARKDKHGMWAQEEHALLTPETAENVLNKWAVVEGKVHATAMVNNTTYLNFGIDWRKDFTIGIPSAVRRELGKSGMNIQMLPGKTVRVHGWMERYNGPYIELSSSEWIEVLPEEEQASTLPEENN